MSELTADLFVSLDGYASAVDVGPYFGYGGPELDTWIHSELDKPQLILLGRLTYEAFAAISSKGSDRGSRRLTESPKAVVSSTLSEPLCGVGGWRPRPPSARWQSGWGRGLSCPGAARACSRG
jgi:hypothetical protein